MKGSSVLPALRQPLHPRLPLRRSTVLMIVAFAVLAPLEGHNHATYRTLPNGNVVRAAGGRDTIITVPTTVAPVAPAIIPVPARSVPTSTTTTTPPSTTSPRPSTTGAAASTTTTTTSTPTTATPAPTTTTSGSVVATTTTTVFQTNGGGSTTTTTPG